MASTTKISCKHFLTLSDNQLVDLVQKFQQPEGYIEIPVSNLEKISDQDLQRIRTRLLSAQQLLKAKAVPLNLDRVNELLIMDSAGEPARLPPLARDSALTDDESHAETEAYDIISETLADEREYYAELIADGGRPLYPIEMLESVAKDPEQHRHLLQPYWRHPSVQYDNNLLMDWAVYHRQLRQHKAFRRWQLDNRGIIEEPDFDAYVEEYKAWVRKSYPGDSLAAIESNPESLKGPYTQWNRTQYTRALERMEFREQGCNSFTEYHAALQRRLAAHGFSEETALLADPRKQDALAEWHEYLGFECWWQDEYTREYNVRLKRYDRNWEFIQRQERVTSGHTPESIENWRCTELGDEKDEARQEIDKAKSKVEKARQCIGIEPVDGVDKGVISHALDDALQRLAEAEKRFGEIERLYKAIAIVSVLDDECSCVKDHVDSQPILIQWVIDQIPLIKAEMKVKAHGRATSGSRKKRTRKDGEDASALPRPKVQKLAKPEETAESEATAKLEAGETVEPEQTKTLVPSSSRDFLRSPDKSDADQMSLVAPLRRSARLAAEQNRTVAPTVSERKTRVKRPAQSVTTRKENKPSTKVDTDTGKRAKRGGNNRSKAVPGR